MTMQDPSGRRGFGIYRPLTIPAGAGPELPLCAAQ